MTKTMSLRVNNDVYTMFTDVCNNEGITISQKLNRLVTDQIALLKEYEKDNKVESEPMKLEKTIKVLDSKPREKLEEKITRLDSINKILREEQIKKKVEPEFTQSKDKLGEYMKMLMSDSRKNNHTYNQSLVKMTFDPYLKDLKKSITDLNTKFEQKIDEDKLKKKCLVSTVNLHVLMFNFMF